MTPRAGRQHDGMHLEGRVKSSPVLHSLSWRPRKGSPWQDKPRRPLGLCLAPCTSRAPRAGGAAGSTAPGAVPRGVRGHCLPVAEATGQVQDACYPRTGPGLPGPAHPIPEATFPSAQENTRIANTGTGPNQESLGPPGQGSAAGSHARRPARTAENFIS